MHSEPHGDCSVCPLITTEWRSDCPHCHGTGRACPGGEVRQYIGREALERLLIAMVVNVATHENLPIDILLRETVYICQACGCVVDAGSVHD
jgi:hypothetical protein